MDGRAPAWQSQTPTMRNDGSFTFGLTMNGNKNQRKEQQLLRHARREGRIIMILWAAALLWSTLAGYFFGYNRPTQEVGLVLGMPDWVFWAVILPWGVCFLFSIWFCFSFMADDDLGQDRGEDSGHG